MNTAGLKVIGRGQWTTCFKLNDKEVLLRSEDGIKEAISFNWGFDSPVFPKLTRVDQCLYTSKYYPKVVSLKKALKPKQYEIYRELRALTVGYNYKDYDLSNLWRRQFATISNKRVREALISGIEGASNYGSDVSFEISPRNIAVDKGMLVLLDVFFIQSALKRNKS